LSKYLLSGSTGYIGHILMAALLEQNHRIIGVSSSKSGSCGSDGVGAPSQLRFDLSSRDYSSFESLDLKGWTLLDFAWDFKGDNHFSQVDDHRAFVEFALRKGVSRVVVAGTSREFSIDQGEIHENSPRLGDSEYGKAKAKLFECVKSLSISEGVSFAWYRFHQVFGEDLNSGSIFGRILRSENPFELSLRAGLYDFVHVRELTRQITESLRTELSGVVDFGSGEQHSFIDFVLTWMRNHGLDPDLYLSQVQETPTHESVGVWPTLTKLREAGINPIPYGY
jgi:dTDP-6-deoxy-L-talose 4-dehydrogenase (NAD+)